MYILGLYGAIDWNPLTTEDGWIHDSGATLFYNGTHLCSIQEERLSRIKRDGSFPLSSIDYVCEAANIEKSNIDKIFYAQPSCIRFIKSLEDGSFNSKLTNLFPNAQLHVLSHHLCHAASSVFTSNLNEGHFISIDGSGNPLPNQSYDQGLVLHESTITKEEATYGYFNKNKNIFQMHNFPVRTNRFGKFYRMNSHELYCEKTNTKWDDILKQDADGLPGKIMGLSAYGQTEWKDEYKCYTRSLDYNYPIPFINFVSGIQGKTIEERSWILQKNFELAIVDLLNDMYEEKYVGKNICLAGGTFLNVLGNSCIKNLNKFDHIHIPPFPSDTGMNLGAAMYGVWKSGYNVEMPHNIALLGKNYDITIDDLPDNYCITEFRNFEALCKTVAQHLINGKIIGWFQGRSENGPRALGSRSILMHPGPKENKDIINEKIKHREYWRPFAGVILEDRLDEYFLESHETPYMLYSNTTKPCKLDKIAAITHEDHTCRIQTVNNKLNRKMTMLLEQFEKVSGLPILLNTSFNDNGQPIVETPKDAIDSFNKMNIDILVLGDFLLFKDENDVASGT